MDLRPGWNGNLNIAYNRKKRKNFVLAAKGLDGL